MVTKHQVLYTDSERVFIKHQVEKKSADDPTFVKNNPSPNNTNYILVCN